MTDRPPDPVADPDGSSPSPPARRPRRRGLTRKFGAAFLLPALTALALMTFLSYVQSRRALEESLGERLELLARLKESALDDWIEHHVDDVSLLASLPDVVTRQRALLDESEGPDGAEARAVLAQTLRRVAERQASIDELFLMTPTGGRIVVSSDASQVGEYQLMSPYYTQGKAGPFVQNVYPSPTTLEPTLTLSTPVLDSDGRLIGVLAAHLSLSYLDRTLLQRFGLGESGKVVLVNAQKLLVSGQDFGRSVGQGFDSLALDEVVEGRQGTGTYIDTDGRPVLGSYRWLAAHDLGLIVEIDQREAFRPARNLAISMATVGSGFLLLLVVSSWLLARLLARPILHLAEAARQVGGGDFSVRSGVASGDEIGALASSFDGMVEMLAEDHATRKRLRSEREALIADLEDKNAELERFAYTVSHDLKSPLVTIKGFLGMVAKDLDKGQIDRAQRDLDRIAAAADRMQHLLEDLLDLARLGQGLPERQEVSLGELVRRVVDGLGGLDGVEVVIGEDLGTVQADTGRLHEVFENLLTNAWKFSRGVEQPRVEVGLRRQAGVPVYFVRDNGVGLDPSYRERVFDLFERLDPAVEGTGVGLTIVRRVIELHGGRVWLESEGLGQGTTVCLTLDDPQP